MSIAVIVAALAASAMPALPGNSISPPIVVDVAAVTDVSPSLLSIVMDETDAVYRGVGVRFVWRRHAASLASIRVLITNESGPDRDGGTPLGWLAFDGGQPGRDIHVSYANAKRFMELSAEVVGRVFQRTLAERDTLLGRALGRALAHELGHYLLATKTHSANGLLKGARTAQEFFSPDRSAFALAPIERRQLAARLRRELDVASRN
jgi:hypothetical protein